MDSLLRLLLIDDDEVDRQTLVRALKKSQREYDIVQASTAADGLQLAGAQHFDAILLDYRLPDKDGLEVLALLRGGQFEGTAVIMLSHQEDDDLADHCIEAGAQDFLLKSDVNSRRLVRAVRQAKQRYLIEEALKNSREELRQLAQCDPLTGLTNRRGFEAAIETAIKNARRSNTRLAVLLLDLDDFKSVNDTLGHDAGDLLLKEIARRLGATVRESDLLCRLGGDEFVILMTDLKENEQAALLAERILCALQKPVLIGDQEQIVTTSIGVAVFDQQTTNASDLLKFADVAMYRAKQEGRNKCRFFSPQLQESVLLRAGLKQELHRALERGEFKLYYQAQINANDGSLGGMEALLRWQHPVRGILAPAAFLSVAEDTGLIVEIGHWVLREACRQLNAWQARLPLQCQKLVLGINLSAVQLQQKNLSCEIQNVLSEFRLDASHLELEITESALIEDTSKLATLLSSIVEQGVSLSLDDFGTGYSSLQHIKIFSIGVLKIDQGFVAEIGRGGRNEPLLLAIIAFAKALNMKVIAEGVETRQQADFCISNGCDLLQGYYYSCPVPPEEFETAFLLS